MSHPEHAQDISPYLNPNYWGGHTLGHGELQDGSDLMASPLGESRFVRQVLQTRVRSNSVVPLQTFRSGDVFSPADHKPGTVVLLREDLLIGRSVDEDYSLDELRAQEAPVRPTETAPSFGEESPFVYAADGSRRFFSRVCWGVVPRRNDGAHLPVVWATEVEKRGAGVRVGRPIMSMVTPLTVGQTVHSQRPRKPGQRLHRVNILHIIAYGTPEQQRRRIFGFAGRTAFGGAG